MTTLTGPLHSPLSAPIFPPVLGQTRIVVRGGGDIATGVLLRLYRAGLRSLIVLERPLPLAVRRKVALCEAVHDGTVSVEEMTGRRIMATGAALEKELASCWSTGHIPVLVDPEGVSLQSLAPQVLVEATLAKRNVLGLHRDAAPLVIAIGPGFRAGSEADCVIESQRGARLGRVLYEGAAEPNTGIPGQVGGFSVERVLRAPADGVFAASKDIGDRIEAGESVGEVAGFAVRTQIGGTLRGLLRSGTTVRTGLKLGDVDPRHGIACDEVSDKALAIGGGVLEAIVRWHTAASGTRSEERPHV